MTITEPLKPSDILLRARDVLIEHGHAKYALVNSDGQHCALGAVFVSAGLGPYGRPLVSGDECDRALIYLREQICKQGTGDPGISAWNNALERTADEVIDTFFDAAILAKEAGD